MDNLRQKASEVLGVRVEAGHWEEAFARLDVAGKLTTKMLFQLLLIILKELDEKSSI